MQLSGHIISIANKDFQQQDCLCCFSSSCNGHKMAIGTPCATIASCVSMHPIWLGNFRRIAAHHQLHVQSMTGRLQWNTVFKSGEVSDWAQLALLSACGSFVLASGRRRTIWRIIFSFTQDLDAWAHELGVRVQKRGLDDNYNTCTQRIRSYCSGALEPSHIWRNWPNLPPNSKARLRFDGCDPPLNVVVHQPDR